MSVLQSSSFLLSKCTWKAKSYQEETIDMEIRLDLGYQCKSQCKEDDVRWWESSLIKHEKQPFWENYSPLEAHGHNTKLCCTISSYMQKLAHCLVFVLCDCHHEVKPKRLWLKASADQAEKRWTYLSSMDELANKIIISRNLPENTYNEYFPIYIIIIIMLILNIILYKLKEKCISVIKNL